MLRQMNSLVAFADELADVARAIARNAFISGASFTSKGDGSPVTEVDETIERELRERVEARYPDHGILGEEYGCVGDDREFIWVIDPIDGTKAFAAGLPNFGTLIALCRGTTPVLGLIELPVSQHRCIGAQGMPTTFNGEPVRTRARQSLNRCVMSAAGSEFYRDTAPRAGFERLRSEVQWSVYGGGCVGYSSLVRGYVDICLEGSNLSTHDYCAYVPVIEGAGGRITDWQGNSLRLVTDSSARAAGVLAAGNEHLLQQALECLNSSQSAVDS